MVAAALFFLCPQGVDPVCNRPNYCTMEENPERALYSAISYVCMQGSFMPLQALALE